MAISPLIKLHDSADGRLKDMEDDSRKQTDAEEEAGIIPVNYSYGANPYNVMRFGAAGDGVTNDAPAFQAAIDVVRSKGGGTIIVPAPPVAYVLESALDCTVDDGTLNPYGFTIRGEANVLAITPTQPRSPSILFKHTGHGFDCSGSFGINFENLSLGTDETTYPKTCFFLARNADQGGSIHRFRNVRVRGKFSEAVVYNYGAEDDHYDSCQFFNTEGGANAKTFYFTAHNIRSLSSSFITIATGTQSTLGHYINGGAFANFSTNAAADVFYLDNVSLFKMIGPHLICGHLGSSGRSHIYVNTVNGGSDNMTLVAVSGEVSSPSPLYGIYIGDTTVTLGNWTLIDCRFPHATAMIKGHTNVTAGGMTFINISDASIGGGGIDFDGTLISSYAINISGGITAGTLGENNVDVLNKVISNGSEANLTLRHTGAGSDEKNYRIRCVNGQLIFSAFNDALDNNINAITIDRTGISAVQIGFFAATPVAKPTVSGSRGGNAALADLLTELASLGLITDSTSA